jgi:hypothetical protein
MLYLQIANLVLLVILIILQIRSRGKNKNNDILQMVLNKFFSKNVVNQRIHYWVKLDYGFVCYVEGSWYCSSVEPGQPQQPYPVPPRPPSDQKLIKPPPKNPKV